MGLPTWPNATPTRPFEFWNSKIQKAITILITWGPTTTLSPAWSEAVESTFSSVPSRSPTRLLLLSFMRSNGIYVLLGSIAIHDEYRTGTEAGSTQWRALSTHGWDLPGNYGSRFRRPPRDCRHHLQSGVRLPLLHLPINRRLHTAIRLDGQLMASILLTILHLPLLLLND